MENKKNISKRKLFTKEWKYKEGFIISLALFIIGLSISVITGGEKAIMPSYPINVILIVVYTILLVVLYLFEKKNKVIAWLSSIPAAISSVVFLTIMSTLLGIIPQVPSKNELINNMGFTDLTSSWMFAFSVVFILTTLGLVTAKRVFPFKKKNIGFLLNHMGLYIVLISGLAGSGDIQRLYFKLNDNAKAPIDIGVDINNSAYSVPFKLKLKKFIMKEYVPKLVIVESKNSKIFDQRDKVPYHVDTNQTAKLMHWEVKVEKYIENALYDSINGVYSTEKKGAFPAAYVKVFNTQTSDTLEAWITSGNYLTYRKSLKLNDKYFLAMLTPEAKKYKSDIFVYNSNGEMEERSVEVNKPIKVEGWNLYQTGYNDKMGKWSDYSLVEAIHDPWLPVVYIGIFMLIAGSLYIFWIGKDLESSSNKKK